MLFHHLHSFYTALATCILLWGHRIELSEGLTLVTYGGAKKRLISDFLFRL